MLSCVSAELVSFPSVTPKQDFATTTSTNPKISKIAKNRQRNCQMSQERSPNVVKCHQKLQVVGQTVVTLRQPLKVVASLAVCTQTS